MSSPEASLKTVMESLVMVVSHSSSPSSKTRVEPSQVVF